MKRLAGTPNPRSWRRRSSAHTPAAGSGQPRSEGPSTPAAGHREGTEQTISDKGLQIVHRDDAERSRVVRRNNGHPVGHRQTKRVVAERTRYAVFFLWLFP
jgi:hypothetical protein